MAKNVMGILDLCRNFLDLDPSDRGDGHRQCDFLSGRKLQFIQLEASTDVPIRVVRIASTRSYGLREGVPGGGSRTPYSLPHRSGI